VARTGQSGGMALEQGSEGKEGGGRIRRAVRADGGSCGEAPEGRLNFFSYKKFFFLFWRCWEWNTGPLNNFSLPCGRFCRQVF
jgi:hypothetical protein